MNEDEKRVAVKMALGRLFKMGSRPTQPDDLRTYADIRAVVMESLEASEARPEPVALLLMRHRNRFGDSS